MVDTIITVAITALAILAFGISGVWVFILPFALGTATFYFKKNLTFVWRNIALSFLTIGVIMAIQSAGVI